MGEVDNNDLFEFCNSILNAFCGVCNVAFLVSEESDTCCINCGCTECAENDNEECDICGVKDCFNASCPECNCSTHVQPIMGRLSVQQWLSLCKSHVEGLEDRCLSLHLQQYSETPFVQTVTNFEVPENG